MQGTVIALDRKRLRRSYDRKFGKSALHLVSAWAADLNLSLDQVKTADKSNETTAIPELPKLLSINLCIVAIDAIGCQKEIASLIVEKKSDYVLCTERKSEIFIY